MGFFPGLRWICQRDERALEGSGGDLLLYSPLGASLGRLGYFCLDPVCTDPFDLFRWKLELSQF